MAFATTNVKTNYFGSLNVTTGDWSGAVGDAPGTLTVKGGRVYIANFMSQDGSSTPQQVEVSVGSSQSGATTTLTIYNNAATTTGRFIVIHA